MTNKSLRKNDSKGLNFFSVVYVAIKDLCMIDDQYNLILSDCIASLNQEKDSADIADLAVLLKTTKILQQFVNSTLMNKSFNQMGGKRRSKKSKKTSRK
jgi:hypothetical protein